MRGKRERRGLDDYLRPNEVTVVELDGVVPGFTRWSTVGGVVGILVALTMPRVLDLSLVVGLIVILGVLLLAFGVIYYGAGRPLGQRATPPMSGPYVSLILTDSRLLLFDRALSAEQPVFVEETDIHRIGAVRHTGAGLLRPQRLNYAIGSTEHREWEFARSERVKEFVAAFED